MLKLSIIVPVYNVENYLRQCLDSLLKQTLHDFEVICINDGSTDSSLDILKEYELRDKRIRVISKENEGYGKTMNRGFNEAKAQYIGIVESDDFVKPEMYEKLYETIKKQSADVVKCNFFKYTAGSEGNIDYSREYSEKFYGQVIEPINYPELYSAHSSIWAGLYKKEFLNENQIWFNETPGASFQDVAFQFKVLSTTKRMCIIPDALLYYRTDNLMSSVNSPYKIYCIFDEIHCMERYVETQEPERQKRLWPILEGKKYYEYRWHCWERLSSIFQFAFFEKMVEEFKIDHAEGKFSQVAWRDPYEATELERMLEKPYEYFMGKVKQEHDRRIDFANIKNDQLSRIGFFHVLQEHKKIIIYGAGVIGRYVAERLKVSGVDEEKLVFAVTNFQVSESEIGGMTVKQIDEVVREYEDSVVLIAVKGEKQIIMLNYLISLKVKNCIVMDSDILSYLV